MEYNYYYRACTTVRSQDDLTQGGVVRFAIVTDASRLNSLKKLNMAQLDLIQAEHRQDHISGFLLQAVNAFIDGLKADRTMNTALEQIHKIFPLESAFI